MWTQPFERFVAPATARPQIWRLLLGLLAIVFFWILGTAGAFLITATLIGFEQMPEWFSTFESGASPTGTLVMLLTFVGLFVGVIVAGWVHGRRVATLFGRPIVMPFLVGAGAIVAVNLLALILSSDLPTAPNLPMDVFLTYLPLALVALLIQTGAEELAFRGYLQTQLAARFRSPLVWMVAPSVAFGALHYQPSLFGPNAIYVVIIITMVGLAAADLTRVSGSIAAAWGLHFANNCVGILLIATPSPLSGLAIYTLTTPSDDPSLGPLMLLDMMFLLIAWLLIRLWLARGTKQPI